VSEVPRRWRRRKEEKEKREPRNFRTIIYLTEKDYIRWKSTLPKLGVKNMEEALMLLLDLYEIMAKFVQKEKLRDVVEEAKKMFGVDMELVES